MKNYAYFGYGYLTSQQLIPNLRGILSISYYGFFGNLFYCAVCGSTHFVL